MSDKPTQYACDDCEFVGTLEDLDPIDDLEERVAVGELMAAGQCPDCGSLISVEDADVPSYTVDNMIELARERGLIPDLSEVRTQLSEALARLEYLKPERFDNAEHAANWDRDMAKARAVLASIRQ